MLESRSLKAEVPVKIFCPLQKTSKQCFILDPKVNLGLEAEKQMYLPIHVLPNKQTFDKKLATWQISKM